MQARTARLLSLSGVLVAGTAAAVVNTAILDGGGSTAAPPTAVGVPSTVTVATTSPTTSDVTSTTISPDPTLAPVPTQPPATPPVSTQATYPIGAAGFVVLDTAGDVLTIVAVTPNPGWVVDKARNKDPWNVEVELDGGDVDVEFKANLLFGIVSTSVETDGPSGGSGTSNTTDDHGGNRGRGGDDDDHGGDRSGHGGGDD